MVNHISDKIIIYFVITMSQHRNVDRCRHIARAGMKMRRDGNERTAVSQRKAQLAERRVRYACIDETPAQAAAGFPATRADPATRPSIRQLMPEPMPKRARFSPGRTCPCSRPMASVIGNATAPV